MPPTHLPNENVSKHRACDGCRAVKKACSKEQEGCSRCKFEEIECHYSEQKHMGRPRKRRCHELETKICETAKDFDAALPALEPLTRLDSDLLIDPYLENSGQFLESGQAAAASGFGMYGGVISMAGNDSTLWNFDAGDLSMSTSLGVRLPGPDMPEHPLLPHDMEQDNAKVHTAGPPCSCLATMYLAISSLQELSSEVGAALVVIRAAANTAQTVLRCEQCGRCLALPGEPAIAAFQNTMLLGTLLPTIVDRYKQLLEMVNHETSMANIGGYKMRFDILEENAICGPSGLSGEAESVENALMDPDDWRDAVHRIIRDDVYGHKMMTPGLKGIISEMEQRQRKRHPKMDAFSHSGLFNIFQERRCIGERNAPCLQILDMTKVALESLAVS
ncbi:hypothetical protein V8E51_005186 [Hyaloscypha variabilis]